MQPAVVAVDVGRTSTRAAVARPTGEVLSTSRIEHPQQPGLVAGAVPSEQVLRHVVSAIGESLGGAPTGVRALATTVCFSGGHGALADDDETRARLVALGVAGPVHLEGDLAAAWFSATAAAEGAVVLVDSGAVAARVVDGAVSRVADGVGWLLGGHGSGHWLGRQAAVAAVNELDGRGPASALTGEVLAHLGIEHTQRQLRGRPASLRELSIAVHRMRAGELALLAGVVLRHADDPVAGHILDTAATELTRTVGLLDVPRDQPVVLAGPLLGVTSPLRARLVARMAGRRCLAATSPLVGAAMLAVRASGTPANQAVQQQLAAGLVS